MANRDTPFGLKPAYHLTGGEVRPRGYKIASGYNTAIYTGDLVKLTGTGNEINVGAASDTFQGVFAGVWYTPTSALGTQAAIFSPYWPASTVTKGSVAADALVYDDPFIVFEVQADEDIVATDIGQDADLVYTAGDSTFGISRLELDSSDIGTGDNLHILDVVDREDNATDTNFTKVYVMINEHNLRNGGAVSFKEI